MHLVEACIVDIKSANRCLAVVVLLCILAIPRNRLATEKPHPGALLHSFLQLECRQRWTQPMKWWKVCEAFCDPNGIRRNSKPSGMVLAVVGIPSARPVFGGKSVQGQWSRKHSSHEWMRHNQGCVVDDISQGWCRSLKVQ